MTASETVALLLIVSAVVACAAAWIGHGIGYDTGWVESEDYWSRLFADIGSGYDEPGVGK